MGNGSLCADYCQNKNPSRFNFSGDASCSNNNNSFQCLSSQRKLEYFCDCQDITSLNCSIEDNIEWCTDFCSNGGEYSRYVTSNIYDVIKCHKISNIYTRCGEFLMFSNICDNPVLYRSALERCDLNSNDTSGNNRCSILCSLQQTVRLLPTSCQRSFASERCVSLINSVPMKNLGKGSCTSDNE